jgi:hypothetical protein
MNFRAVQLLDNICNIYLHECFVKTVKAQNLFYIGILRSQNKLGSLGFMGVTLKYVAY